MRDIFIFTITFLLASSCYTKPSNESMSNIRYYLDIDLFRLTGVNEISQSEIKYPYVQVDSINPNEKKIAFYYDENTIYMRNFKREDSVWRSTHIVDDRSEGATFYYFDFLTESQIIFLEYKGNPQENGSLVTLKILKKNEELVYDFDYGEVFIQPTDSLEAYPIDKNFRTEFSKHEIKDGVLEIVTTYEFKDKEVDGGVIKRCFRVDSLSYFWWLFIGHKLEKSEC